MSPNLISASRSASQLYMCVCVRVRVCTSMHRYADIRTHARIHTDADTDTDTNTDAGTHKSSRVRTVPESSKGNAPKGDKGCIENNEREYMRLTRSIACENKERVRVLLGGGGKADRTTHRHCTSPRSSSPTLVHWIVSMVCPCVLHAPPFRHASCHVTFRWVATCHTRVGPSQQLFLHHACNGACNGCAWPTEQVVIAIKTPGGQRPPGEMPSSANGERWAPQHPLNQPL